MENKIDILVYRFQTADRLLALLADDISDVDDELYSMLENCSEYVSIKLSEIYTSYGSEPFISDIKNIVEK